MPYVSSTPKPPYYAVVFTSVNADTDHAEHEAMSARMLALASAHEGFLGIEPARNPDGTGVAVSYWRDLETIRTWAMDPEHAIAIDAAEISESFVRASGPGGQNVNNVATAVRLRFDVRNTPSLPEAVRARLERLAGRRLTQDGVLVINAQRFRTQERNREDALERLIDLIRRAAEPPPRPRRPTRPSAGAKRRRVDAKTRRGAVKRLRGDKPGMDG